MVVIHEPPPIVTQHQTNTKGICFHVTRPCFTLNPPKNKKHDVVKFHTQRMKSFVKYAQSPDMNLTLKEIQTGIKTSDRMKMSLAVYILGVLAIFLNRF